jgi:UDP-3-O-[3-hydroxymyristoyl] N-acetylglucosamine deacetylase
MLDTIGVLALAGYPILGAYRSLRGGHRMTAHILKALFADDSAWSLVQAPQSTSAIPATRTVDTMLL